MIVHTQSFSDFEQCARIPGLKQEKSPERFPVRYAVRRDFIAGLFNDPEKVAEDFLAEAATQGFWYSQGEPYELAKDYACWLDGALRLAFERFANPEPLPVFTIAGHDVFIDGGVQDRGQVHIIRSVTDLADTELRWAELIACSVYGVPVAIHQIKLPGIRGHKANRDFVYRLGSHLVMGYEHPMTGQIRLARIDEEKEKKFTSAWKRVGRWEIDATWEEWRAGLDNDRCLDQVISSHVVELDSYQRKQVVLDAAEIIKQLGRNWESHIRKREACGECLYAEYCHGNQSRYVDRQNVQAVQSGEAALVLP